MWFWFVVPWWLAMLSIFPCASWPPICLPWKNVYSGLLPILIGFFSFFDRVVWAVHIFWILTTYQSYHLQIFLPFGRLSFHFISGSLLYAKAFKFSKVPFGYFCFCFLCFRRDSQKKCCYRIYIKKCSAYVVF